MTGRDERSGCNNKGQRKYRKGRKKRQHYAAPRGQAVKGIFEELVRRMEAQGGAIHPSRVKTGSSLTGYLTIGHDHDTPFDPEALKRVADDLMEETGVRVFFHAQFLDAVKEGDRLSHIIIADKSGIRAIRGDVFIDCTGDADVAVRSGVDYVLGDGQGTMQPATMNFRVCNVDEAKTRQYVKEHPDDFMFIRLARKAREAGDFPINRRRAIIFETSIPGVWMVNSTRIQHFDGTDADQRSKGEAEGRRQVKIAFDYLKKYVPGFSEAVLMDSASEIGARETRHIRGLYELTEEDIESGRHFEDCIAMGGFPMDIHDNTGRQDRFIEPTDANYYEIPYRCMVPETIPNLLVAGRPVCAAPMAAAAIRIMPTCIAMGEAAGVAASLSHEAGAAVQQVDTALLRRRLAEEGACVELP